MNEEILDQPNKTIIRSPAIKFLELTLFTELTLFIFFIFHAIFITNFALEEIFEELILLTGTVLSFVYIYKWRTISLAYEQETYKAKNNILLLLLKTISFLFGLFLVFICLFIPYVNNYSLSDLSFFQLLTYFLFFILGFSQISYVLLTRKFPNNIKKG